MAEEKFNYDSVQDRETIGAYLTALAEGFRSGALTFSWDENEMTFHPDGVLAFSIEARLKDNRRKLILKVGWSEGKQGPKHPSLQIGAEADGERDKPKDGRGGSD